MAWEQFITLAVALGVVPGSWFIWVTLSIFEHRQKLALMKQELDIMESMRDLLSMINARLSI